MTEWLLIGIPLIEIMITIVVIVFITDLSDMTLNDTMDMFLLFLLYWIPIIGTILFLRLIIKIIKWYNE